MSSSTDATEDEAAGAAPIKAALDQGRRQFLELVEHVRPDLHRYCARMTGSLADGEDVVQDTLARAYYQFSELDALTPLRPWLFRIAHNLAIDHYRRSTYRRTESLNEALEIADDGAREPDHLLAQRQAVGMAVRTFLQLAPAQRACVILKDVLDHSLEEIAAHLDLTVPAVKAALHRGRTSLVERARPSGTTSSELRGSPALLRYTQLFNAHDWEGIRAMLANDVRLDVVSKSKSVGRSVVGQYFTNYDRLVGWHMEPAWLDGHEVVAVYPHQGAERALYFVDVDVDDCGGEITSIHDFRHVPYIMRDAVLERPPRHRTTNR
ncbi:sigma-70 family RNA polymerase sigma factor [soil metagenome]